jgi:hypothetical protein
MLVLWCRACRSRKCAFAPSFAAQESFSPHAARRRARRFNSSLKPLSYWHCAPGAHARGDEGGGDRRSVASKGSFQGWLMQPVGAVRQNEKQEAKLREATTRTCILIAAVTMCRAVRGGWWWLGRSLQAREQELATIVNFGAGGGEADHDGDACNTMYRSTHSLHELGPEARY